MRRDKRKGKENEKEKEKARKKRKITNLNNLVTSPPPQYSDTKDHS